MDVDMDLLISLVEERLVIVDKTSERYKDRNKTFQSWKEICAELNSDFEQLDDNEKDKFGKDVMKKWKNVRDSYRKSQNKIKETKKSGSGAQILKTYIYDYQLQFLDKIFQHRTTEDSLSVDVNDFENVQINENDNPSEQVMDVSNNQASSGQSSKEPRSTNTQIVTEQNFKKPRQNKKKLDPIELEMIEAVREKPNRQQSFFNGILPSIEDFDEFEVLEFQMDVLKTIKAIKLRKQRVEAATKPVYLAQDMPSTSLGVTHKLTEHNVNCLQQATPHYTTSQSHSSQFLSQSPAIIYNISPVSDVSSYEETFDFSKSCI